MYLVCTPTGMPITWALTEAKIDEREVLAAMADREPSLAADRPGLMIIADKGFASREFEADLAARGITLLRPAKKTEQARNGESLLKSVRQLIESVNDTLKGQLDLEQHGGRTFEGVAIRVAQRILARSSVQLKRTLAPGFRKRQVIHRLGEVAVAQLVARFEAGTAKHKLAAEYGVSESSVKRLLCELVAVREAFNHVLAA